MNTAASHADRYLRALLEGEAVPLRAVSSGTGGRTGVFTIWYRGELLYLGRSTKDPSTTGNPQADGVTGRLRMVLGQPPLSIQRALKEHWPEDWRRAPGTNDRKRASHLLAAHGECRLIRFATGAESEAVYQDVLEQLRRTQPPLADHRR